MKNNLKNKINILFICGNGMGTSTMAELGVKNNLKKFRINAELQHTSLGQMGSLREWADIVVILKNLMTDIKVKDGEYFIPVVNIMDGKGITEKINEIVIENFPDARF